MNKSTLILSLILLLPIVYSIIQLPCEYWGKVYVNGELGTGNIIAQLNGKTFSSTITQGYYNIQIPGDDPDTIEIEGGRDGDKIILKFKTIEKEVEWHSGSYRQDFSLIIQGGGETGGETGQEQEQQEETNQQTTTKTSRTSSSSSRTTEPSTSPVIYVRSKTKEKEIQEPSITPTTYTTKDTTKTNKKKKNLPIPLNIFLLISFTIKVIYTEILVLVILVFKR